MNDLISINQLEDDILNRDTFTFLLIIYNLILVFQILYSYASEELIIGYDLLNEPVLPPGYSNTDLRSLYVRIITEIRALDTNHIVFIEGNWYATDFTSLTPPMNPNLVYAFHKYWSETTISTIQPYLNIRNEFNVPLWLGESGENFNPWFYETIQLMEENDIGNQSVAYVDTDYKRTRWDIWQP